MGRSGCASRLEVTALAGALNLAKGRTSRPEKADAGHPARPAAAERG